MKVLVTANFTEEGLRRLSELGLDVAHEPWSETNEIILSEDLADKLSAMGAEAAIIEVDLCHEEVFEEVKLKFVGCCRGEPINVDIEEATDSGVPVLYTPGRNAHAVADLTMAMVILAQRPVIDAHNRLVSGRFDPRSPAEFMDMLKSWTGFELNGKTLGIVGLGAVGSEVAKRARPFGCPLVAHDPYAPPELFKELGVSAAGLNDLFEKSDIVTIHAAINDDTEGMITRELIGSMKPDAHFINLARAELVDDDALFEALDKKRIAGAALDVFKTEPPTRDERFLKLDNVIVTPHIAGATRDVVRHQTDMIVADVEALLKGEKPRHCANPEVLD